MDTEEDRMNSSMVCRVLKQTEEESDAGCTRVD
jgi:hypothetical protein